MRVLGLASDFHDSSAALVIDGKLVAAAAEERFTRNKHDSHFPKFASDFCLEKGGVKAEELDLVVFYEQPFTKWVRVLESSLRDWPHSRSEFVESQSEWLGKKLWTKALLSQRLQLPMAKIAEVEHHRSHLVQAFVGSPFSSAAVLTVDAVGERSTASMAMASWKEERLHLEELGKMEFPHSLGLFYSAVTAFLGFQPMNDECSVMALAAFGRPTYCEEFRKILRLEENGFWTVSDDFLHFDQFLSAPWTKKFTDLLGSPRVPGSALSFSSLSHTLPNRGDMHWADVAASAQLVLEDALLHSARFLRKVSGEENLCFAGGVALNCVANTRLAKESGFKQMHIPIEPGDSGASIGAAFAGYFERCPSAKQTEPYSVYLGDSGRSVEEMVAAIDVPHSWEYQRLGTARDTRHWAWEKIQSPAERAVYLANELKSNKVVGLFQGRFELGPRALGHRSILFRSDSLVLAERVSKEIKERASFRPYALSLLAEDAEELLDLSRLPVDANLLRWMQLAVPVNASAREALIGGAHVDGTTRPQLVGVGDDAFFYALLRETKKLIGYGALVNTSMNESGYPLVGSSEEALLFFARTSLDILVIDDLVVRKV